MHASRVRKSMHSRGQSVEDPLPEAREVARDEAFRGAGPPRRAGPRRQSAAQRLTELTPNSARGPLRLIFWGQCCGPTHGPQTNWWSDGNGGTNDEDTDDEGTHTRSAKTISQEDAETTEMGVVDATAARSYNPSKLSDTTRYAPKCQSALRVALGAMLVMSVANCSGLTQSLSKCGEFVRENKMGSQSFPSARRLGITLFGNAPNSEAPSYQKFAESIPDELETVISFGDEVKGDSERWNLRIQDYLPTFRGAQSLVPHADKFMWVRAIRDWCRRGYSQLRLVFATEACYVTFSVMAVDSRGKPVHKMGVFAWTEMLIPAWTVYLLTPLLAGLLAFGAVADPETGELYELRIFHGVVGVAKERSILVLTWTIMAGTVAAAVAACKAIIENYVARNSRGPPANEGVEATPPLSHDDQLGRRELAAKAEKNDELFIKMHGRELFEVKREVMAKHGHAAWLSVRHFIEANGIEAWREEKKRFAELGYERWRIGRRSGYVEALHERVGKGDVGAAIKLAQMYGDGRTRQPLTALAASADADVSSKAQAALEALRRAARIRERIRVAQRCVVLAARAASDPDDKYVQMAHDVGLRTALAAMVKECDEEEKGVARAELEALRAPQRRAQRRAYVQQTEAKSSITLGEFMARPDAPWAECRALNDPFARALASGFDEAAAWWAVAPNTEEEAVEFWGAQPSLHGQVSPASCLWYYRGVTTAGIYPQVGPDLFFSDFGLWQHVVKSRRSNYY